MFSSGARSMALSGRRDEKLSRGSLLDGEGRVAGIFCRRFRVGWKGDGVDIGIAEFAARGQTAKDVGLVVDDGEGMV